jgi:hypothetical protein
MEENKPQKYTIVSKEVDVINRIEQDGETVEVPAKENRDFVVETPKPIETLKEDKIAQLEQRLAIYQAELARNQEMVDGLQAELLELTVPNVVK